MGEFGPITRGLTRTDVKSLVGEPPQWVARQSVDESTIWRYEDVEVYFDAEHRVHFVFTDHEDLTSGAAWFEIDPWIVRRGLALSEFLDELRTSAIEWVIRRCSILVECDYVLTAGGAVFAFQERPDDPAEATGLFSWSNNVDWACRPSTYEVSG